MVTDYDVWKEHTVNYDMVIKTMKQNIDKVRKLLTSVITEIDDSIKRSCNEALKNSGM